MRHVYLLAAALVFVAPAQADPARDALAAVAKCADIPAAADRLQCYDTAAEAAKMAMSGAPPAAQRQAAVQTQEEEGGGVLEWFGLQRPVTKTEDFGKPPVPTGPKEIKEISATVVEFAKNAYGRSIFILDNGQVWKQVDGDTTEVRDPSRGETMQVSIETGMFGSYSLTVKDRTGIVKVRRVK
jgi:uncharacterized protein YdeI (BOF family)